MTRLIFLVLAAVLALLIACGSDPTATQESTVVPQSTATGAPPAATDAPATAAPTGTTRPTEQATDTAPDLSILDPCEGSVGGSIGDCAPEFMGTQEWINSEPLTMESLRGKVVLIDFWTYTCVNCIRTLPFLREWYDRYADEGLVIVGVHTPEFEFEKLYNNVVQATKDEGVAWPVVQDNEFNVWRSYSNRYWPAKYLIDQTGEVRFTHFGEGKYAETEQKIRELLLDVGSPASMDMPLPDDQGRDETFKQRGDDVTRELFAGWKFSVLQGRGGIGQGEDYFKAAVASNDNEDLASEIAWFSPPESLDSNLIYFNGPWAIGPESARHAEQTDHFDHYLELEYSARSVNAVLTSESGDDYQVRVTVNGEYLTEDNKGDDITIGEDGVSYLQVDTPRLYKIIEHPTWEGGQVLRMASMSDDFGLFSFTFGIYEDGY